MELYRRARDYDLAFSWDRTEEVRGLRRIFRLHARREVRRVLEPCCGPGRYSTALARAGLTVAGYDLNPDMTALAEARAREEGVADRCRFLAADMRDPGDVGRHDAAVNLVNSIGYLRTDDEIRGHLAATRDALGRGGLYVVQVSFAFEDPGLIEPAEWTGEEAGARFRLRWHIEEEDHALLRSRERCTVEVVEGGDRRVLEEVHELRLWRPEDLRRLVREAGGLTWTASHDAGFRELDPGYPPTGEIGNVYVVLRKR